MASSFSLIHIIQSLRDSEAGTITEEVWTYVATREQECARCKRAILPGQRVSVGYKGKTAQFVHAKEKA